MPSTRAFFPLSLKILLLHCFRIICSSCSRKTPFKQYFFFFLKLSSESTVYVFEKLPDQIKWQGRTVDLDLLPTRKKTKTKTQHTQTHKKGKKKKSHTSQSHTLPFSLTQICTQMQCRINVVLNLAYYKHSANASWVNRCPWRSISLSYNERQSCRFIYKCDVHAHAPKTRTGRHPHACTFGARAPQPTSRLQGFILLCVYGRWHCMTGGSKLVRVWSCGSAAEEQSVSQHETGMQLQTKQEQSRCMVMFSSKGKLFTFRCYEHMSSLPSLQGKSVTHCAFLPTLAWCWSFSLSMPWLDENTSIALSAVSHSEFGKGSKKITEQLHGEATLL